MVPCLFVFGGILKAILHYALGLRFGKVYEQNASKTQLSCVYAQCIV